jgi:hypothetical protein
VPLIEIGALPQPSEIDVEAVLAFVRWEALDPERLLLG